MQFKLRCTLCTHLVLGPLNKRYPLKLSPGTRLESPAHHHACTKPDITIGPLGLCSGNLQTLSYTLPPIRHALSAAERHRRGRASVRIHAQCRFAMLSVTESSHSIALSPLYFVMRTFSRRC